MTSPRMVLRLLGDLCWWLGWAGVAAGLLLLLVGREPSPGSEWPVAAIVGPFLIALGVLGVLLGGILRLVFRR
jgi:hypothetical protein